MNLVEMAALLYDGNEDVVRRKADAKRLMRSAFEVLLAALMRDGEVRLPGIGKVWIELRRPYWHPHPQTGELALFRAKLRVHFAPTPGILRELRKRDLSWAVEDGTLDDPCPAPGREGVHDVYSRRRRCGRLKVCRACGACEDGPKGRRR